MLCCAVVIDCAVVKWHTLVCKSGIKSTIKWIEFRVLFLGKLWESVKNTRRFFSFCVMTEVEQVHLCNLEVWPIEHLENCGIKELLAGLYGISVY